MLHVFSNVRIRPKLIFLFLMTGVIPLAIVGLLGGKLATDSLMDKSFNQLITVQSIRKGQIEDYFRSRFADISVLAESVQVKEVLAKFDSMEKSVPESGGAGEKTQLKQFSVLLRPQLQALKNYTKEYGYSDLYIVDADHGHVLFSVSSEKHVGMNLRYGKYKESALASAWEAVVATGRMAILDFAPFASDGNAEAAFIAHPVVNPSGTLMGVLVLQLAPELVTRIVDSRQGMGKTGESYLIGVNDKSKAFEFRSNMKTMGDGRYVVGYSAPALDYWKEAVREGEGGGVNTYLDSAGAPVLVAFNKLNIPGLNWYLISKIDKYEVTAPVRETYREIGATTVIMLVLISMGALFFSRTITRPIISGMHFAQEVSEGRLDALLDINQKDEIGDLAKALNRMVRNLRELDWLKVGKEGLDDELRGEHESHDLAKRFIAFFTKHMSAQIGALYLLHENVLELQASYAFTDRKGNFNHFRLGEGMVGQSALEQQTLIFSDVKSVVDGDTPAFNFGAGEIVPSNFMAIPIVFEGVLLGVALLGSTSIFTPLHKRFVDQNIENAAILLNAAKSRQMIRELLEQAHRQQEALRVSNIELEDQAKALRDSEAELQAQQEELRVTNEELEEQAKALKESEAELQAQQEELRVTNEELEEHSKALLEQKEAIREKNADLVKAQAVVQQKARDLEIANKYKSEFLANMSHELRTPLNSILILSQLLTSNKDGNLTDRQIESAKAINSSGSDLLTLINEILDLSKIEAGKVELVIDDLEISQVLDDTERLFRGVADDKGVNFTVTLGKDLPDVIRTDSQRLQQVLRNLLTNAFKFTSNGTVSLTISRPDPAIFGNGYGSYISFAVKDEGIGIPENMQAYIFQAFKQADGGTSRKYGGTGLGLSISKELARLLGGRIHLQSEEGKGSTFTVIIPAMYQGVPKPETDSELSDVSLAHIQSVAPIVPVVPVGAVATVVPSAPGAHGAPVSSVEQGGCAQPANSPIACDASFGAIQGTEPGGNVLDRRTIPSCESDFVDDDRKTLHSDSRSLLIIEDNKEFARIIRDFARERGFKCIIAGNGETGLHYADYYKPSAIILDIGLPGIDGWTVMERLKDNADLRHIPVHFMSANDSSLDAMRMGAVGYLAKPVTMETVEATFLKLEEVISKPVRKLLLVEDDAIHRQSIQELIGNGDVTTTAVASGREALQELHKGGYDCMILDLGLEDMSGFDLLDKIRLDETLRRVPIIIYTGRDLTREEERELNRYAESIIVKGVKSPERLLDESALFLHRVEANLPDDKRRMLKMIHDKEAVFKDKTILLVDDDMRNVFALSSLLEDKSVDVVIAKNGLECLEKLKDGVRPDAILMDIMMPLMDGYEAMREIRKQKVFAKLPIIALTAKAMKGDRSKCIEAGASDYLAKPVNTDKLLSMLRVWLY